MGNEPSPVSGSMALASIAATLGSELGSSTWNLGKAGALLCLRRVVLFGLGRSSIEKSGDSTFVLGDMLLSDLDVGLICCGAAGGLRWGGCTANTGSGGIVVGAAVFERR